MTQTARINAILFMVVSSVDVEWQLTQKVPASQVNCAYNCADNGDEYCHTGGRCTIGSTAIAIERAKRSRQVAGDGAPALRDSPVASTRFSGASGRSPWDQTREKPFNSWVHWPA
jgi:hypothetical protein